MVDCKLSHDENQLLLKKCYFWSNEPSKRYIHGGRNKQSPTRNKFGSYYTNTGLSLYYLQCSFIKKRTPEAAIIPSSRTVSFKNSVSIATARSTKISLPTISIFSTTFSVLSSITK